MKAMERTVLVSFIVCKTVTSYFMINVAIYRLYNRGRKKCHYFVRATQALTLLLLLLVYMIDMPMVNNFPKQYSKKKNLIAFLEDITDLCYLHTILQLHFSFPNEVARFRVET